MKRKRAQLCRQLSGRCSSAASTPVPWPTVWVQLGECLCWIQLSGYYRALLRFEKANVKEQRTEPEDRGRKWSKVQSISQQCVFFFFFYRNQLKSCNGLYLNKNNLHDNHWKISSQIIELGLFLPDDGDKTTCLSGWMGTLGHLTRCRVVFVCSTKASFSKLGVSSLSNLGRPVFKLVLTTTS